MRIKGGQWASNEIKKIPLKIFDLLRGNSFPPYTEEMKACDQKLAQIFGGDGAAVTTIYEPKELKNADGTPRRGAGDPRPHGHSVIPANERIGINDRGGVIHIYANEQGLPGNVGVYAPAGFERLRKVKDINGKLVDVISGANNLIVYYSKERNLYICYAHVATNQVTGLGTKNKFGSIKIGLIGGPGGKTLHKKFGYEYFHTHIAFYSEFFNDVYTGIRVDPRDYFCK